MPRALVVLSHPESGSFTAAWAQASVAALEAQGYDVLLSDLYRMGFDPARPEAPATEVERLLAADLLVLHFPLWWFAPPAVVKGWCDRVLEHGVVHSSRARFDAGRMRGRKVLFCVSTGATEVESGPSGKEGNVRMLLWPLALTFRYCGYDVFEPVLVHGVHAHHPRPEQERLEQRLRGVLARQAEVFAGLPARPLIPFNPDPDFDAEGRLKPTAESVTPFIRHDAE